MTVKKIIKSVIYILTFLITLETSLAANPIGSDQNIIRLQIGNSLMKVNGQEREIASNANVVPVIKNNRILIPITAVIEVLGGQVQWNKEMSNIMINAGEKQMEMWIGKTEALVDGNSQAMDVAPEIIENYPFAPVRFVAENLGYQVTWEEQSQSVMIESSQKSQGDVSINTEFAKGADVGWLAQLEQSGIKFINDHGQEQDCLEILKDHGINSIRLRAWVNPTGRWGGPHCTTEEVVAMAVRAKKMGLRIMIDLHYSDFWADPQKQNKPAAWANHSVSQLITDIYDYTYQVMIALKEKDITPEWVQVGNEITNGMLWPEGHTDHFEQLTQFINSGYDAVKNVFSESRVVIHLDNGYDNKMYVDFFDKLKGFGGKYDVIGMSYYPYWTKKDYTETIDDLGYNLKDMASRYHKEVMICEIGGEYTKPENTHNMILDAQKKVKEVPDGKGLGVFYWEPEAPKSWSHYELGAWGEDGKPTAALDAFLPNEESLPENKN